MKAFQFRLGKLLSFKTKLKHQKKLNMWRIFRLLSKTEDTITNLENKLNELVSNNQQGNDAIRTTLRFQMIDHIQGQIRSNEKVRNAQMEELHWARQEWLKIESEVSALEKLKKKKKKEFRKKLANARQSEIDEIAIVKSLLSQHETNEKWS